MKGGGRGRGEGQVCRGQGKCGDWEGVNGQPAEGQDSPESERGKPLDTDDPSRLLSTGHQPAVRCERQATGGAFQPTSTSIGERLDLYPVAYFQSLDTTGPQPGIISLSVCLSFPAQRLSTLSLEKNLSTEQSPYAELSNHPLLSWNKEGKFQENCFGIFSFQ